MDKDAPNSSSSPTKVYAFWKDFDLEKENLYLAEKRKKLTENKENSIKKQKKWGVGSADQEATSAEASAKATSVEVTSAEASLLLDYIAEVNRADEAENAFIELSDKICRVSTVLSICSDDNQKIKWDFEERKGPFDGFKRKEPRFLLDYIPKKYLGGGAFGKVFSCEKRIERKLYAVKKIPIKDNAKPESILSEVYALSRVVHPNIIRYYDAWIEPFGDYPITKDLECESSCSSATTKSASRSSATTKSASRSSATTDSDVDPNSDALYIQMELCHLSLRKKVLMNNITKVEASKYMRQITEGLHYLHENKVVHGDLSSQNVLLDGEGNAIIVDFGLVVIPNLPNWDEEGSDQEESDQEGGNQEESDQEGEESDQESGDKEESDQEGEESDQGSGDKEESDKKVGQPGNLLYLAPERKKKNGSPLAPPSLKWDIYSLGIIFLELVEGFSSELKFLKFDRARRIHDAKNGKFTDIPISDGGFISKMISVDPEARPSTKEVREWLYFRRTPKEC